jgi:predicted lipid-binding transport protein (Tim44 family)
MKRFLIALCMLAVGAALTIDSAEAARLGGGRSIGSQRAAPMQRQAQPAAPAQAAKPAAPAPAAPAPAGNRWLGPIAGLAAGLGLGYLLGQGGMGGLGGLGGMLGSVMMMLLVAFAAMALFRWFARRNAQAAPPMQYAGIGAGAGTGLGNETVAAPPPSQMPSAEAGPDFRSQFQPQIPPGFDADGFLKQAKLNFVRLQEANDRGNVDALREITTEDMFAQLKLDLLDRAGQTQQTDVVTLTASLLEVVTEGNLHWASVRFAGSIRETPNAAPAAFEEVWHLQKPADGKTGWLLAGIQQPTAA